MMYDYSRLFPFHNFGTSRFRGIIIGLPTFSLSSWGGILEGFVSFKNSTRSLGCLLGIRGS